MERERADRAYRRSTIIFAVLVLVALVLKALLLSVFPINEDEFSYLSRVYTYERGELATPFQNFHVHFFGWLSAVGQNEVTQVIAARVVMYLLFLGTCLYLFRIARYFLGVRAALFCVLCYLCFLFTMTNGASFRTDSLAIFFIVFALYHFIVREDSVFSNDLAGLAMAVSLLFTIKAAIYLPVFAGWFLSRRLLCGRRAESLIRTACFMGAFVLAYVAFYELHSAAQAPRPSAESNVSFLGGAFSTFITFEQLFPARHWIIQTLVTDFFVWFLLFVGLIIHLIDLLKHRYARTDPKAFLPVLLVPLLSLLVYRNAGPYFWVFLMPAATVFCGYAFEFLASKLKSPERTPVPVLSLALGLLVLSNFVVRFPGFIRSETKVVAFQRDLLATIHRMFPEPVPYVDAGSMVSSYPKVGFFMSKPGMRAYLRRGVPIMDRLLTEKKPLFLLKNSPYLDLDSNEPPRASGGEGLFETDWTAMRSYFIHHWGPVWVAGKQFNLDPRMEPQPFEIVVPGPYTIESGIDVLIDGTLYRDGDVVRLEEGAHTVATKGVSASIRLRWGNHLYRPTGGDHRTRVGILRGFGPFCTIWAGCRSR